MTQRRPLVCMHAAGPSAADPGDLWAQASACPILTRIIHRSTTDEGVFRWYVLALEAAQSAAVAKDFPALTVKRILAPMINEAIYSLDDGVGLCIGDRHLMRSGANRPMGPLELADFIRLDAGPVHHAGVRE